MMSIEDIYMNFGKNIYVYPTTHVIVKGASIDLSASQFAWSVKSKKSIYNDKTKMISIPANDTAIIFTNEVLYVTNKIAGSYHSKVSFVAEGLGHIGTSLDPEFIGLSKLAIHNHSNKEFLLPVNHTIVSVCFHKLDTKVKEKAQPDCQDFVTSMRGFEGYKKFKNYVDQRPWIINSRKLKEETRNDSQFKEFRQALINESVISYNAKAICKLVSPLIFVSLICLILCILFYNSKGNNELFIALLVIIIPPLTRLAYKLLEI